MIRRAFYRAGKLTLFDSGGEEDLLALYLVCDRQFPEEPEFIVLDDDLWDHFKSDPAVLSRKKQTHAARGPALFHALQIIKPPAFSSDAYKVVSLEPHNRGGPLIAYRET